MSSIDRVNISNPSLEQSYGVQGKDQVRVGQNGQSSSGKDDSVALSSTAREAGKFAGIVGQSREERIEQVRQMIEAGSYNVSGEEIARKMIESNRR
jgi:flagellar biosynthesis anti-sigma factor FlgM